MAYAGTRSRHGRSNVRGNTKGAARAYGRQRSARASGARRSPKKDYIHPSRFVKKAKVVESAEYIPLHAFDDFMIHNLVKKNIASKGFAAPSPIQDETIPLGLSGKDVIGIANTGTGKTVAFLAPALNRLLLDDTAQVLVIAPTRELAQQIENECRWLAKGSGLTGALLIGGTPMGPQLRELNANPRIIIGTPGRIKDHLERGSLTLDRCNTVVLDEVDRMLDMGFLPDVTYILGRLHSDRQSFFFSATLDARVRDLIGTFARNPVTVSVKTGDTTDSVHQDIVPYESIQDKIGHLHDILIKGDNKTIIFDDTQRSVERLAGELSERGFSADAIHGGKTQGQRQRALKRFKDNQVRILVATDVAARGIDVSDITHVINYSTPTSYEDYVHRIGRAGRAGRIGYALTFVEYR